jgi:uncharacterized protein YqfA (UPF0365 family)
MSPFMRILAAIIGLALLVFFFWIGLFLVLALAAVGIGLAIINAIKMKLTGRPLFASRVRQAYEEARRRQGQAGGQRPGTKGNRVIEGEVVNEEDKDRSDQSR